MSKLKKDFWDLTKRPYSKLKLKIVSDYLETWLKIMLSKATEHPEWQSWQEIFIVDCCAGRGKYHDDGEENCVDGSPIIALKLVDKFIKNYPKIKVKCIFLEENRGIKNELEGFCNKIKNNNFCEIINENFNIAIDEVLLKTGNHPTFFFIDPQGIDLNKECIKKITQRKGPTDLIINYIKGGVERITGLIKKDIQNSSGKEIAKYLKTVKKLEQFYGLEIFSNLEGSERKRLREWGESIFTKDSQVTELAVFAMPYQHKAGIIYYLIFGSKHPLAKKIITDIFKQRSKCIYGQQSLDLCLDRSYDL